MSRAPAWQDKDYREKWARDMHEDAVLRLGASVRMRRGYVRRGTESVGVCIVATAPDGRRIVYTLGEKKQ